MTTGWYQEVRKDLTLKIPKRTWTSIATVADLSEGPNILTAQLYGTLPTTGRPLNIRTRWLRVPLVDATAYHGLTVGTLVGWEGLVPGSLEYIGPGDTPLDLQIWHDGTSFTVTAVIVKILAPAAYIAARIAP